MRTLEKLVFDNQSLRKLPVDKELRNYVRRVANAWWSLVTPEPIEKPRLVSASQSALELLSLDFGETQRQEFAEYFGGCRVLNGSQTAAHCYCGHQFGYFSGQLGDGAAMYLGEVLNTKNERWEIQLKGAGKTPYSRSADGRKVLRSSIREYLCSELMHHLGIPTTRAGCVVTSDTYVARDIHYTGDTVQERASVVLRIAPSFIRFGSYEVFKGLDPTSGRDGPSQGDSAMQKQTIDFICEYFPDIKPQGYLSVYQEIVRRTADLVAGWQCAGWCHGVLNTDNMSILGLTLDYGPYGFLESYDEQHICNGSDHNGRYSYENQPQICKWNCLKLAEAWDPILPEEDSMKWCEATWDDLYRDAFTRKLKKKLGVLKGDVDKVREKLFSCMARTKCDFTLLFRALTRFVEEFDRSKELPNIAQFVESQILPLIPSSALLASQLSKKAGKLQPQIPEPQLHALLKLAESDPNGLCRQLGIPVAMFAQVKKELEEDLEIHRKREALSANKKILDLEGPQFSTMCTAQWVSFLEEYAALLANEDLPESVDAMKASNPTFILRNWVLQDAIAAAEKGDNSIVEELLRMCCDPFNPNFERSRFCRPNDTWSFDLCVTCSS